MTVLFYYSELFFTIDGEAIDRALPFMSSFFTVVFNIIETDAFTIVFALYPQYIFCFGVIFFCTSYLWGYFTNDTTPYSDEDFSF
jgi:hypothetical protein